MLFLITVKGDLEHAGALPDRVKDCSCYQCTVCGEVKDERDCVQEAEIPAELHDTLNRHGTQERFSTKKRDLQDL